MICVEIELLTPQTKLGFIKIKRFHIESPPTVKYIVKLFYIHHIPTKVSNEVLKDSQPGVGLQSKDILFLQIPNSESSDGSDNWLIMSLFMSRSLSLGFVCQSNALVTHLDKRYLHEFHGVRSDTSGPKVWDFLTCGQSLAYCA